MKRIFRFIFIVVVMIAYNFAFNMLFSPILEQFTFEGVGIVNESAMFVYAVITQAFAAVIFMLLYIKWYIAVPEHKREFLKHYETADYNIKSDIIHHIEENNGNIDILIYAVYSVILPLSIFIFKGSSPITFLFFHQLVFYNAFVITGIFIVNLVFSYMCSILFFILVYIIGVAAVHKIWYKKRLRR